MQHVYLNSLSLFSQTYFLKHIKFRIVECIMFILRLGSKPLLVSLKPPLFSPCVC